MNKKWIYILLTSSLIITLVVVFTVITVQKKNDPELESSKEDIKIVSEVIRETGSEIPTLKDFGIKEEGTIEFFIQEEKVEKIDNTKVSAYDVKMTVGEKEYTSILKFEDTIAPEVNLKEVSIEEGATYTIENFIESCKDISSTCHYSYESEEMGSYQAAGTYKIVILTEDDSKNVSKKETTLTIQTKKQEVTITPLLKNVELGADIDTTSPNMFVTVSNPIDIESCEVNTDLNSKKVGKYQYTVTCGQYKLENQTIIVSDTTAPVVKLKTLVILPNSEIKIEDFVDFVEDESDYSFILSTEVDTSVEGTYEVPITVEDDYGNKTKVIGKLVISADAPNSISSQTPTPAPPAKTFVEKKDEVTTKVEKKYGTTITYTTTTTYNYYSDNSKEKVGEKTTTNIDYSTFNATTAEMKPEAKTLYQQNVNELKEVLKYVNQYRSEVSASPLVLDETLSILATVRAIEMGWSNNFSHTRPNGKPCFQILEEENINGAAAENIAFGYANAAAVSEGWKNSSGHYKNMTNSDYRHIGIGKAVVNGKIYWVQIFTD